MFSCPEFFHRFGWNGNLNSPKLKTFLFASVTLLSSVVFAQDCQQLSLNPLGFNADIIAEGMGGDADDKTNYSVDAESFFSNVYYAIDFVPENPSNAASAEEYGGGFPLGGTFNSNSGISYQLADYSGNNSVLLRNTVTNNVTLTFDELFSAEMLYFATFSSEGAHNVNVTINFSNGATQTGVLQPLDWYQPVPPTNTVAYGFGRVSRGTGSASTVNTFSDLGVMGVFEEYISIDPENQGYAITSIVFDKELTSNDAATSVILAVTACEVPLLGINEVDHSSVAYYPNPASDFVTIKSAATVSSYEIFDLTGRILMQGSQLINQKINISGLEKGTYVFKLKLDNGKTETFKISKK